MFHLADQILHAVTRAAFHSSPKRQRGTGIRPLLACIEVTPTSREAVTGDSLGRQAQVFGTNQMLEPRRGDRNVQSQSSAAPSGLGFVLHQCSWGLRSRLWAAIPSGLRNRATSKPARRATVDHGHVTSTGTRRVLRQGAVNIKHARRLAGFTLLEVLLALGLTTILMAAVYASLDMYWQMSSAGRDQVEQSQLARAVLRTMSADIRSVVMQQESLESSSEESPDEESTDDASAETEDETAADTVMVDPAAAYANNDIALYGDAQTLVLQVSRPARDLNYSLALDGLNLQTRSSDLLSVSYFLAVAGADGLQGAVGNLAAGGNLNMAMESGVQGLARSAGDKLAIQLADQNADYETLAGYSKLLAPEINFLQFTYLDGVQRYDFWDSSQAGRLPSAIEIVIGIRQPETGNAKRTARSTADVTVKTYRFVVSLPLAEPYANETEI